MGAPPMSDFISDLRFAWRTLFRSPGAASIAILALALGIGVNISMFIYVDSILLHPFPYPRLERIVTLWETRPHSPTDTGALAPANYFDWRDQSHSFAEIARYRGEDAIVSGAAGSERVQACLVSPEFFQVMGIAPKLGRTFSGSEDNASEADWVVVSEGFWSTHLGGTADLANEGLIVNGHRVRVVGVMPDRFDYPLGTEMWIPVKHEPAEGAERTVHSFAAIALLRPDVTVDQAGSEAKSIAERLSKLYGNTNEGRGFAIIPLRDMGERVTQRFLEALLGAALFVLLLACANVGNLQVARATARHREFAVRSALGAGRYRIARHLVAECLVLSLAAAVAGLVLASWNLDFGRRGIPALAFREVPGLRAAKINPEVVLYTLGLSVIAGLICSLPSILQLLGRAGTDLGSSLRERGTGNSVGSHGQSVRSALIVFELALSLVLLVGAGLMVKTFEKLLDLNQGFDPTNVLTMKVTLPPTDYADAPRRTALYDRVLTAMRSAADVRAAAIMVNSGSADGLLLEGREKPRPGEPRPETIITSAQYLEAMHIPLMRGRWLKESDRPDTQKVAVISKNLADHYWRNADPIGHRIRLERDGEWFTVVGVAGNVIEDWFQNVPAPRVYLSYTQKSPSEVAFAVRTNNDPLAAVASLKEAVRAGDANLPVYDVATLKRMMMDERSGVAAAARMMTTYAVIALLLAITGVYAVVSYFVTARTHDFGVRMALGASRNDVMRMTLRQTTWLVGLGLAVGLPLSILLAHALSAALFGVVTIEPGTFVIFSAVLASAALVASYLPSRRATHIDPMEALRVE